MMHTHLSDLSNAERITTLTQNITSLVNALYPKTSPASAAAAAAIRSDVNLGAALSTDIDLSSSFILPLVTCRSILQFYQQKNPESDALSTINKVLSNVSLAHKEGRVRLRTLNNGKTLQNWKQNSDGSQEADLVTLKGDKTQYIGFRLKNSTESYSGVAFVTALGVGVTLNFPSRKSLDEAKKAVFTDKYIDEKDRELSELKQQLSYLRAQLAQKAEKEPHKRKAPDAEDIETKNTNKISKPST